MHGKNQKYTSWYLRTPGENNMVSFIVNTSGSIEESASYRKENSSIGYCPAIRVDLKKQGLYKKVKKAKKQKNENTVMKEFGLSRDVMNLKKGETIRVGTEIDADIQVGVLPNISKNKAFTLKMVGKPSDCISMKKLGKSSYEITAKKQGETTLLLVAKEKVRSFWEEDKKVHPMVLLHIGVREKNTTDINDFQRVAYDKSGSPIYHKVRLGAWAGQPLFWRILDIDDEKGTALLLCETVIRRIDMVDEDGLVNLNGSMDYDFYKGSFRNAEYYIRPAMNVNIEKCLN